MPWSHRLPAAGRTAVTLLAGLGVALVGTLAHRMGASMNIPYGLALAYAITALSTYCARARQGVTGLALHLIASSAGAWGIALFGGPGGDALVVAGFSTAAPFFSQHAGYAWLYGVILVQVVMLAMPSSWFRIPPRRDAAGEDPSGR
ncbi:alcohol dehydrogenase [Bifidobacterium sp. SMA15]|uniref:Alcohol dehydrogenase n=2 Tax=Bifidobacterium platyrrhinorum TaxID=2661628 RepID=A0A6L9SSC8_9BIFI|nr:alcohol dehydrogenase [Bifidobacterium platyrrhinorum]NEG54422.1 alcohol dehydrogenase [Bifidobacterium platyrrhinorum]